MNFIIIIIITNDTCLLLFLAVPGFTCQPWALGLAGVRGTWWSAGWLRDVSSTFFVTVCLQQCRERISSRTAGSLDFLGKSLAGFPVDEAASLDPGQPLAQAGADRAAPPAEVQVVVVVAVAMWWGGRMQRRCLCNGLANWFHPRTSLLWIQRDQKNDSGTFFR